MTISGNSHAAADAETDQRPIAIAEQMGEDAARGLLSPWVEAEPMLRGIWREEIFGISWAEARDAVYEGWLRVKHELGAGE